MSIQLLLFIWGWVVTRVFLLLTATVEAPKIKEEGSPASDHQRSAAAGRGRSGRNCSAGSTVSREHTQKNGTEYGFTGAKPAGVPCLQVLKLYNTVSTTSLSFHLSTASWSFYLETSTWNMCPDNWLLNKHIGADLSILIASKKTRKIELIY